MTDPETRPSLMLRVRDPADHEAWDQFSDLYRPVIRRMAMMKGMQDADADDLAQQVLLAIAGAIVRWDHDPDRAKFRTWLKRVTGNAILNAVTRGVPDVGSGAEQIRQFLEQRPADSGSDSDLLQIEYRREVFSKAAEQIRSEFTDDTWLSFWLTAVDSRDVDDVAAELGRTRGSVYASRSRVMKRLRQAVEEITGDEE